MKFEVSESKTAAGERVVVIGGEAEQHRALRQECAGAEVLQVDGQATVEEIAAKLQGGPRIDHVVFCVPPDTNGLASAR